VARRPPADGAEWEAAARGDDARPWPWGHTFDPDRCNCAEAAWGWTVPVHAHPDGASPCGAEQLAGNVWEWVSDERDDGWGVVRGGCYLDTQHGLHAARELPADPTRATATTGFRVVIEGVRPGPGRAATTDRGMVGQTPNDLRRSGWIASS
jgi:formylglycine-generating enzyme required for sulfatase activity